MHTGEKLGKLIILRNHSWTAFVQLKSCVLDPNRNKEVRDRQKDRWGLYTAHHQKHKPFSMRTARVFGFCICAGEF